MHTTDTAAELALATSHTLRDPEHLLSAITPATAPSLCDGLAGTALLHACLTHHDPRHAVIAAQHWRAAAHHLPGTRPAGIHSGKGGLAASLIIGTGYLPDPDPYHQAVSRAVAWLSARAQTLAGHQLRRTTQGIPGSPWAIYDAVNGLAGIGRVLLAAHQAGHHPAERGLDAAVSTLTGMINTPGDRPGWWLPAADHAPAAGVEPSGAAATGLAHGIAGPLSFLTSTHQAHYPAPERHRALQRATQWLLAWQEDTGSWPPLIHGDALADPARHHSRPGRRHAWCYGAPGIAATLKRTGTTLHDDTLIAAADRALTALTNTPPSNWDTEGPTLCHGTAGILQAATRTQAHQLADVAATATTHHHDPTLRFRFPHIEATTRMDRPGLLTGATGIALTLADHGQLLPDNPRTTWDALLLLS